MEVRLDKAEPLLDAAFDVSSTFSHIAEDLLAGSISTAVLMAGHVVLTSSGKA